MAFRKGNYRRKGTSARRISRVRVTRAKTGGLAASPAGKHRKLALNCFAIARRARAAGNYRHYWKMVNFGKRALALAKAEIRLWRRGKGLTAQSFATHRKVRAQARA
jgi:hypothetical protein